MARSRSPSRSTSRRRARTAPAAAFAPVGGSANPTSVLTYAGPTSNDQVTVNFRQTIGRTEALRTGAYSKTLTFTLLRLSRRARPSVGPGRGDTSTARIRRGPSISVQIAQPEGSVTRVTGQGHLNGGLPMVGRGLVSLLGAAIVLGIGAPAALSDDGQRLIMVEHSPFMIEQLEKQGYDVGFIGEKYEAAVYHGHGRRGEAARRTATSSARSSRTTTRGTPARPRSRRRPRARPWRASSRARASRRPASSATARRSSRCPGQHRDHARLHVHELRGPLPLRRGAQQGAQRHLRPGDVDVVRRC